MAVGRSVGWGRWQALVALLLLVPASHALQYQHDELLWTKQNWNSYKLDFPWAPAVKQRDAESTRQMQGPLQGFASNTLNGPLMDAEAVAALVEEDARRGNTLHQAGPDISLLDEEASLEAAAGVAQCKVCGTLARLLWANLTRWVEARKQVPNKKRIAALAEELCEHEVMVEVLRSWVLLRARVGNAEGLPFALEAQGHEFYMLSKRAKQHATPTEIAAVRRSCRQLLHETEAGKEKPQLLNQAASLLQKHYQHLAKRVNADGGPDGGQPTRLPSVVEAVDDGPAPQRACYDRHPQCALWRDKGECERNPKYMLGDAAANNGWCRAACGACAPPPPEPSNLTEEQAAHMATVASDLLAVLQTQACLSAAPCRWAAGDGMQQLLQAAKEGAGKPAADLLDSAEFVGGPVLSKQQLLEAAIDQTRLKESRPMLVRELNDAVVPDPAKKPRSTQPPEQFSSEAGRALWDELGAKCLYVNTGWWMYEVCYMHHILQFHMDDKHNVDWVISLGSYQPGSSNWTATNTSLSGLYPHFTQVPYASQRYSSGNHCDLDPDERGTSRSILRSTELRLMCSPDGDAHVVISEPEQCLYVVELYVPQLCTLKGFQVDLPAELAGHVGFALNPPTGGATGAPGTPRAAGGAQQAQRGRQRPGGQIAAKQAEEDEYADPDELEAQEQAAAGAQEAGELAGRTAAVRHDADGAEDAAGADGRAGGGGAEGQQEQRHDEL